MVCLLFGALSILAITKPFNKKPQNILSKPAEIRTPRIIHSNHDLPSVIITDNEIRQVHAFKHSLDSLSATTEGKVNVNKLLSQRPGLLDSLEMVEQLYYLQKK